MPRGFVAVALLLLLTAGPGGARSPLRAGRVLAQGVDDPCAVVLQSERNRPLRSTPGAGPKSGGFGTDKRDVADLLVPSAVAARTRLPGIGPLDTGPRATATRDIDDIAVIEDDGTLILRPNPFDLGGAGLRFEPTAAGYDLTPGDASFRPIAGRELPLGDDDTAPQTLGFSFPYYGRRFPAVFVNSDGNLTFGASDIASTARGFSRLLDGPPRIAPLFADLDPSSGGHVFVESSADVFAVTWCAVPGFDSPKTITMQVVLTPQGTVDLRYRSGSNDVSEGIAALSPGGSAAFTPVDLTRGGRQTGGDTAIGERFGEDPELDLAQTARRFYQSHPDDFDQLVFWSDTTVVSGAFAFESTVKNAIRGIGVEEFDNTAAFGSSGTLESVLNMDRVGKYGDDPAAKIVGENSSLAILAHETGHRWLAQLLFSDGRGGVSDQLLGRQRSHWSFFMDTDASVMEGNDISAATGSTFRTVAAAQRYSRVDLYAMGLVGASEVPAWFFVDAPVSVVPSSDRETAPRVGTTFRGTRRNVLIQNVIEALGPRVPSTDDAPRLHRQAFIYVIQRGSTPREADLTKLTRIRRQWEPYFRTITEQRMTVRTTLQN